MAKRTAIHCKRLEKIILVILLFNLPISAAFSQVINPDSSAGRTNLNLSLLTSLLSDSIPNALGIPAGQFKHIFLSSLKNNSRGLTDLISNSKKELTGTITNIYKNPLLLKSAEFSSEGMMDSSYLLDGQEYFRNNLDFNSDWLVAGIPVTADLQRHSWSDVTRNDHFLFSFQFDRDNYLAQLKKRLVGKFEPTSLVNSIKNPIENVITEARKSLTNELEQLSNNFKGILNNEVQQIKNIPNLLTVDVKALREKLLNKDFINDVNQKTNLLASLQQRINNGEPVNPDELKNLENSVIKMKGIQELLQKIEQHQAKWEQSGLLKKIKEFELLKTNDISKLLNDPSTIIKMARAKLSLSGFERLFLNISHLDLGQNALSLSPLSLQHFLSKGINTGFISNNRALTFIAGRQSDFNSILDYPFTNSLFSNNGMAKAIRMESGAGTKATTSLSVSSFSQSMSSIINQITPAILRQVLVTTISNQLSIGEKGMINVELSRSATQYSKVNNAGDSFLQSKNNLSKILSPEDLMANTAISLKYADELSEQGLSYNINFNKTANGYTNPGNSYLSAGSTEIGTGIRKSLLKKKLLLSFRGNAKIYKYNDQVDASWLNTYMQFDAKWKMKKGQYITIRYQPVKMSRHEQSDRIPVSSVKRLAVDASIYKKIGKVTYRNYFSLSGQKNDYTINPNTYLIKSSSLTLSSFQNILIGKKMLYINLNYNYAENSAQYAFLNSSQYAEAGYSYQLGKNITASSGLIYNSIHGWYSQAGIRQSISGQLGKQFSLNSYVDLKKNLKVIQSLWSDPIRADISMRYFFIKKN